MQCVFQRIKSTTETWISDANFNPIKCPSFEIIVNMVSWDLLSEGNYFTPLI